MLEILGVNKIKEVIEKQDVDEMDKVEAEHERGGEARTRYSRKCSQRFRCKGRSCSGSGGIGH